MDLFEFFERKIVRFVFCLFVASFLDTYKIN